MDKKSYPKDYNDNVVPLRIPESAIYDEHSIRLPRKIKKVNNILKTVSLKNYYKSLKYNDKNISNTKVLRDNITKVSETVIKEKVHVNNKKAEIASTINNKGVPTESTDDFETIANNIKQIQSGDIYLNDITIDGYILDLVKRQYTEKDIIPSLKYLPDLPNGNVLQDGCAVVYKGSLYVIGAKPRNSQKTNAKKVYKLNSNSTWLECQDLPEAFFSNCYAIYDGLIHILQGGTHYTFDGVSWGVVGTLPKEMTTTDTFSSTGIACSFKNYLYYFPYSETCLYYKYSTANGWQSVGTVSTDDPVYRGTHTIVATDTEMHMLYPANHLVTTDGMTWKKKKDLPFTISATTYPLSTSLDRIYLITEIDDRTSFTNAYVLYYVSSTDEWVNVGSLPYNISGGSIAADTTNKKIYLIGGNISTISYTKMAYIDVGIGKEIYDIKALNKK